MKKIISLGLASAVCALTAMSASADVVKYVTEGDVKTGNTVTVTMVAGQDLSVPAFTVEADGFEVVSVENKSAMASYNADTKKFTVLGSVANGGTVAVLTLKVTAEAGKDAKLTITDFEGRYAYENLTLSVAADETPSDSKTDSSESSDSKTDSSESSDSKTDDKKDDSANPGTGIALAVVPAVLAAAGVVVAKKRK